MNIERLADGLGAARPSVPARRPLHLRRDLAQPRLGVDAGGRGADARATSAAVPTRARLHATGRCSSRRTAASTASGVQTISGPRRSSVSRRGRGRGDRDRDRGDSAQRAERPRLRAGREALLHRSGGGFSAARRRHLPGYIFSLDPDGTGRIVAEAGRPFRTASRSRPTAVSSGSSPSPVPCAAITSTSARSRTSASSTIRTPSPMG